jgi:hypothetical protein
MEVETADDVADEVIEVTEDGPSKHTPLRGVTHTTKRKGGELFSGTANKIRPT